MFIAASAGIRVETREGHFRNVTTIEETGHLIEMRLGWQCF